MEDRKSFKLKTKKVIKEDYEQNDDQQLLEDNDEVYEGVHQAFIDNIESVVSEMNPTEEQYDALQEAGFGSVYNPDLFDEMLLDDEVNEAIQTLLKDDSNENWNNVDQAIQNWVVQMVREILDNTQSQEEQEDQKEQED